MIRAISLFAGTFAMGLAIGCVSAAIFVMGWTLYVVGVLAAAVLVVSLAMIFSVDDIRPADRGALRRSMWAATVSAAVLLVVVLFA